MSKDLSFQVDQIGSMIRTIRGQRVILDADLARIYAVPTKALNQAVKRNPKAISGRLYISTNRERV